MVKSPRSKGDPMNFIIFDLEWNAATKKHHVSEIFEIAAIKVKEVDGMLVIGDSFHSFVRPMFHITDRTKRLTQVKVPDTWLAKRFPQVYKKFLKWIGKEDFVLCSWGPDDKREFMRNCELHHLQTDLMNKHLDFQKIVSDLAGLAKGQQIGLLTAVAWAGLPFEGVHHSALDDARNTANLFVHVYKNLSLRGKWLEIDAKSKRGRPDHAFEQEYCNQVKLLMHRRISLQLDRKQFASRCGLSTKSIMKIEQLKRVATAEELQQIQRTLDELEENPAAVEQDQKKIQVS
ncbi:UNVERIFIED_CONTAM: inhibitor of KinA sporulation pathway (predicted exonuclease) [Brevibacillus sp. OAP136]